MSKSYKLRKSNRIFRDLYKLYRRKKHTLESSSKEELKQAFEATQQSLLSKDARQSSNNIHRLEMLSKHYLKKNLWDHIRDFCGYITFALILAILVRQMWFEFYEIPTGSMRPTFKEQDRLVVSKNQFGINIPLTPRHLMFEPSLVQRGGIVVFTGENMDIQDVDTLYFYLFPGKKQYIKRMIGKPGDTLYFYGGRLYGINQAGQDISHELQRTSLDQIDHIPFISFEGKVKTPQSPIRGLYHQAVLYQMNEPIAKLSLTTSHHVNGEMLPALGQHEPLKTYDDLWGFKNYAVARLLTKKEYLSLHAKNLEHLQDSDYYLELTHHPNLYDCTVKRDLYGRLRPTLGLSRSIIPLTDPYLNVLFKNLYTARFIVDQNGYAYRYGYKKNKLSESVLPKLSHIPAGTYEFYYGKAYEILWQGIAKELPTTHPIYRFSPKTLYTLFNLGIEFDNRFLADAGYVGLLPSRYAFFRNQDLYVMGAPLFEKQDPILQEFLKSEHLKTLHATNYAPYVPFIDHGAPVLSNGLLDIEFIKKHGITIPQGHYLVLGDNYAMSADSRDFGFVPQSNLRGVPNFIFWPPGYRFGTPNQPHYPVFVLPRMLIWIVAGISMTLYTMIHRKRYRMPLHF